MKSFLAADICFLRTIPALLGMLLVAAPTTFAQEEDKEGCRDHPMFPRMPNFYIYTCQELDSYDVRNERGAWTQVRGKVHRVLYEIKTGVKRPSAQQIVRNYQNEVKKMGGNCKEEQFGSRTFKGNNVVEGPVYRFQYYLKKGVKDPGRLAIIRNYTNAAKRAGGQIIDERDGYAEMKFTKDGKEIWCQVEVGGFGYNLSIVEKAEMEQVVEANAESWKKDIAQTGKVALYGIYFDTGKSTIKPESEPALKEIAKLLNTNSAMKLHVVGHTDNVGELDYNLKLSKARADAVMNELVTKHKISSARLKAHGVGPLSPVASNSTEEGKAKNRRVELVEQ